MTYSNHAVMSVKDSGGRILRESQGKVYLPYDSEYSLYFKNTAGTRACASITIDGTDILGGHDIIIPAYGNITLERFMLDGSLTKGKRLKFVRPDHPDVQDPTSAALGEVVATMYFEAPAPVYIHTNSAGGYGMLRSAFQPKYFADSGTAFCASASDTMQTPIGASGATVEGSASSQSFQTSSFTKSGAPIYLRLKLMASSEPVTVHTKNYCNCCGKRINFSDNYCPSCGQQQ